ncbi:hypothetical protein PoB_005921200 [Plakobranchus ocellatus]|uniref:Uncharacterized protein n=1 Tax=Plakobranchus ocellatus TaxID=259542 RepID=A0AAV4CLY9_9GAST|nr:hypothetical protein PoB_005921200 [Plakobranchus ocellatus]
MASSISLGGSEVVEGSRSELQLPSYVKIKPGACYLLRPFFLKKCFDKYQFNLHISDRKFRSPSMQQSHPAKELLKSVKDEKLHDTPTAYTFPEDVN